MLELHDGLVEKQDKKSQLQKQIENKENTFADSISKFKEKKGIRKIVKIRKNKEELIDLHKKQCLSLEIYDLRKKVNSSKRQMEELAKKIETSESKKFNLKKKIDRHDSDITVLQNKNRYIQGKLNDITLEIQTNPAAQLTDEIEAVTREITNMEKKLISSKKQADNLNNQIQNIEAQLDVCNEVAVHEKKDIIFNKIQSIGESWEFWPQEGACDIPVPK